MPQSVLQRLSESCSNAFVVSRLALSEAAGDAIYEYGEVEKHNRSKCLALAQTAYSQSGAHRKAVLCMCKQGQIFGAMDYLQQFQQFPIGTVHSLLYFKCVCLMRARRAAFSPTRRILCCTCVSRSHEG